MAGVETESLSIERFRLEPGAHPTPRHGVCIVELASLLAGEEFSDRPRCVCEVIAAFLRSWNDRASYVDRQRLLPYAERIVDTCADPATTRRRRDICLESAGASLGDGALRRGLALLGMRFRIAWMVGIGPALQLNDGAPAYAARVHFSSEDHDSAFELLDRLLEVGEASRTRASRTNGAAATNGAAHANGASATGSRNGASVNGAANGASVNGAANGRPATGRNGTSGNEGRAPTRRRSRS